LADLVLNGFNLCVQEVVEVVGDEVLATIAEEYEAAACACGTKCCDDDGTAVPKRMVSDASKIANDLRNRWMSVTNVVVSCCDVALMGNSDEDL
jgi:hypothetical protein